MRDHLICENFLFQIHVRPWFVSEFMVMKFLTCESTLLIRIYFKDIFICECSWFVRPYTYQDIRIRVKAKRKMDWNNLFARNWVDCDKKETRYKTWSYTIYTVVAGGLSSGGCLHQNTDRAIGYSSRKRSNTAHFHTRKTQGKRVRMGLGLWVTTGQKEIKDQSLIGQGGTQKEQQTTQQQRKMELATGPKETQATL